MSRGLPPTLRWVGGVRGHVALIDQTLLPGRLVELRVRSVDSMWDAIRRLAVRGAPAIGVAAAYGVALGAGASRARDAAALARDVEAAAAHLATSRPTAVNLFWALDRMRARLQGLAGAGCDVIRRELLAEARAIHEEDAALCAAIGQHGARLLRSGWSVLTHCNAGALATGGSGTALAVIYEAARQGKRLHVYADETRPLLQGARLTSWELLRSGINVTLLCDNAAASLLRRGAVQCVVVGADRIARNGDTANKIGTYGLALLARAHGVPFYVAAPSSTFDLALGTGAAIPIEQRAATEVTGDNERRTAPRGVQVYNPAFDVTPARLISGIITERGILRPPLGRSIAARLGRAPVHQVSPKQ